MTADTRPSPPTVRVDSQFPASTAATQRLAPLKPATITSSLTLEVMVSRREDIMIRAVSWNIAHRSQPWRELVEMQADLALLQEAGDPPPDVASRVKTSPHEPWQKDSPHSGEPYFDRWTKIVCLSDRVEVKWFRQEGPAVWANEDEILTSGIGTSDAALVTPLDGGEPFIAVSMYARWVRPHPLNGSRSRADQPDGSAHRIISDISAFVGTYDPLPHRILAAGDLNMSFGGTDPFRDRAQTVLDRMKVLGFKYAGPQYPNGRRAQPVPSHLTSESLDVPTHHSNRSSPAEASVQLDHVFASLGFHEQIATRALNKVDEWGSSDHCRIVIDIQAG